MTKCYKCLKEINKENVSVEHIIPNAVGGRLKSKELLCKTCNSDFGDKTDIYLGANIPFTLLLNIKRDRDKPYRLNAKDQEGREYHIDFNEKTGRLEANQRVVKPIKRKREDGKISIEFIGDAQAKSILKSEKKRNEKLNTKKIFDDIKWRKPRKRKFFYDEFQLEGEDASKAISKIAINFFIHSGGESNQIKKAIDYVSGKKELTKDIVFYFYPEDEKNIIERGDDEVSHTLYLSGQKGVMLFCYVDLFSIYQYIVILNDDYQGDNIKNKYSFDVIKQEEITEKKKITLEIDSESWKIMTKGSLKNELLKRFDNKKRRVYKIGKLEYD